MRLGIFILSFSIGCAELSAMGNINQVPQTRGVKRHATITVESLDTASDTASQAERKTSTAEMATQTEPQMRKRQKVYHGLDQQLIDAVKAGNFAGVYELLNYKKTDVPDVNVRDMTPNNDGSVDGLTPLMIATSFGYENIVKFLIHHGADLNMQTMTEEGEMTALTLALSGNGFTGYPKSGGGGKQLAIARILIDAGADVNKAKIEGLVPLHAAIDEFCEDPLLIQLLLESGARVENVLIKLPTIVNILDMSIEIVRMLIDAGMDVNFIEEVDGPSNESMMMTSLHSAIKEYRTDLVRLLLEKGANPYIKNGRNQNAFDYALSIPIQDQFGGYYSDEKRAIIKLLADFEKTQTPEHKQALQSAAQNILTHMQKRPQNFSNLSEKEQEDYMKAHKVKLGAPEKLIQEFLRPTLPGCAERQRQLQQQNQEKKEKANKSDFAQATTNRERMNDDTN